MSKRKINREEIFNTAVEMEAPAERSAYLDGVCADDRELRADIESLLASDRDAGDFLEAPVIDPDVRPDDSPLSEGPGTVIGRYKLLEKIGEGGMAVVYMAEQAEPIRRKIALKIIKLGMDTRQVIARFEAERQALALMDHPNIAKVLDAGATETGRPYFVMELVTGVAITEYCDKNNASTKDRLALFLQVCNAVQHAHQKGIIHRDIKPSNVMVTMHDGLPVPKVIDFGIAKATNQKLTEKTLFTRYAHIIGTPAYMSPEQAELNDLDIDTRSDIYSLGVLLYELLTGTTPFSEEELREVGYLEMQRIIREAEPTKPSTKLSTLGETLTEIARHRNSTPDVLSKAVRGDLDWIVMKSLEKDRSRRYETASALGLDIQRHLDSEPVLARGPSATYRLGKFLHRHRVQASVLLTIGAAAIAVSVILSMWGRDRLQLVEAEGFRDKGILSEAREQYARADRDAALETLRPILTSKHVGPEARLLQAGILVDNRRSEEAAAVLEDLLDDSPEIAGTAHSLLARILWESMSPDAERLQEIKEHREQAEALLPETAEAYFLRAMTAVTVKEQLSALDRALELDAGHYESRRLRAFTYYASRKYEKLEDDALVMTILRPRDPLGYSLRAVAWRELGRYPEAIEDYELALGLTSPAEPQYLDLLVQRSDAFLRMGDYERVIAEAEECLKHSADNTVLQHHTFGALTALGEYEQATTLFRQIIALGPEARREFDAWSMTYVFETLEAGRSWHPPGSEPKGAAFLSMLEAEETHRSLSAKAYRVTTNGFSARWSPDGTKLAFSLGVHGYSGVALYDRATQETDLLIVPGKDPRWSPDGKQIAFVRDCQLLKLAELTEAEGIDQHRPVADEEVWIMRSDGTEPRRLAKGSWPSWGHDCRHLYYVSRVEGYLYSLSLTEPSPEPNQIMKCSRTLASVSPDNHYVAYLQAGRLIIADLASQTPLVQRELPSLPWGLTAWSPSGGEVCVGGIGSANEKTGLWIYNMRREELSRVVDGQVRSASWSPQGTDLAICLGPPYRQIWAAHIDPKIPTVDALSPAQTLTGHFREMVAFYTRRIQADPNDAYAYSTRALYHGYLGNRREANADMKRWSAVAGGAQSLDSQFTAPRKLRRLIDLPFNRQLVFSAERPVNKIPTMSVAFGQKGRCEMKLFEVPMAVTSLLGIFLALGFEAPSARADFTFGQPVNLKSVIPVIDPAHDDICCFSTDGLEIYIDSNRPEGQGAFDLWVLKRASTTKDWGPPENLTALNSLKDDGSPCISADGLTLYFSSDRDGGYGKADIYMTTRTTKKDPWGPAVNMGSTINGSSNDANPWILANGLEFYFWSGRPDRYGRSDVYVAKRVTREDVWATPVNVGPVVNTEYDECALSLSPDGLLLFFSDDPWDPRPPRPGGYGGSDMWMTRRTSHSDSWQTPVNLGSTLNGPSNALYPRVSPDGSMFYFLTLDNGNWNNWQAPILPVTDFNGDGKVNGTDVVVLTQHWSQSDSVCDIGPYAWGDGIVDEQDLFVLAEYLEDEEPLVDPTLIAHWALDEAGGTVAYDSAGDNNGTALGDPVWLPDGGMVGGALALDGVDDCVVINPVSELSAGPFSVLAWVKGGAADQVIVSCGTTDWLYTNPADGSLMTALSSIAGNGAPLFSDVVITDGQWHRIGLLWDGSDRILYVDGQEAARDEQAELAIPDAPLIIGAGATPNRSFSGQIDDLRIYRRAVKP